MSEEKTVAGSITFGLPGEEITYRRAGWGYTVERNPDRVVVTSCSECAALRTRLTEAEETIRSLERAQFRSAK